MPSDGDPAEHRTTTTQNTLRSSSIACRCSSCSALADQFMWATHPPCYWGVRHEAEHRRRAYPTSHGFIHLLLRLGIDNYGPTLLGPLFFDGSLALVDGAVLLGRFPFTYGRTCSQKKTTGICQSHGLHVDTCGCMQMAREHAYDIYIYIYICIYIYTCLILYNYTPRNRHVYFYVCIGTCIYTHIYIYIYI